MLAEIFCAPAMASACDTPGATFAKIVIARCRSLRVMACKVGCCTMVTRSARRTSWPLALLGEQAHAGVVAPALVLGLAGADAADGGPDGVADGGHAHAEVGRLVAIGDDLHLGHADLVVAVHVRHLAGGAHGLHDLVRVAGQPRPIAAAHGQLHREAAPAAGAEALLRGVL